MTYIRSRWRMGMLTPSSNTVLEPMVEDMLQQFPEASAHFSRLPVTQISLAAGALKQFHIENHMTAAKLLSDAKVNVIGWNGTSASWVGFDGDKKLCETISSELGIPATTAVLAINELLEKMNIRQFGLVTPYVTEVQNKICDVYAADGYECISEYHFKEHVNFAFAEIDEQQIEQAIRQVAQKKPQAIVIMCTNLAAAHLADKLEAELGITIIDSISAFVWKSAALCGIDTSEIKGWGKLFNVV